MKYFYYAFFSLLLTACQTIGKSPHESPWRGDLDIFKSEFLDVDKSYIATNKNAANRKLVRLRKQGSELSPAQFELRLAEIVALADNAHTTILNPHWTKKFNRIPIKFLIADSELFIADAEASYADLIGEKVDKINGTAWPSLVEYWSTRQSGQPGWTQQFVYSFLESPQILHAAGFGNDPNEVKLSLSSHGLRSAISIDARSDLQPLEGVETYFPPDRIIEIARERSENIKQPLYLQDPNILFRSKYLETIGAYYIQFKSNLDFTGEHDISDFTTKTLEELKSINPKNIIVDHRFNFGGDLNLTRAMMQKLPGLSSPQGKIYIIISGRTFSAGISSVGYLKQAGQDKVVIVGTPVGDRLEFWAEGDTVELPHSGITLLYATERHNYMTGCPKIDCHGSIQKHPIEVDSLEPDFYTPLTYDDYFARIDPSMEKIINLIQIRG